MTNDKADFTQGNILKKLVAFMMPVLGALILQAAYGAVDLLVVGRFGSTSGLSAVSTGSQILNLVTFVVIQFAMGITVLIARYLGEKKDRSRLAPLSVGLRRLYHDICRAVYCYGRFCTSDLRTDAGTGRSGSALTASYVRICGSGFSLLLRITYCLLFSVALVTVNLRCCLCWWHVL